MSNHGKQNNGVKAVYEDQYLVFLQNIGIYDKITKGEIKCKFCGKAVTFDNLASVFPESNTIKVEVEVLIVRANVSLIEALKSCWRSPLG